MRPLDLVVLGLGPGVVGRCHREAIGQEIGKTMAEKVTNDLVAFVKGIAQKRGRNAEWAEKAVRESVSVTEKEALDQKVIDVVADDVNDLIQQIDGWEVADKGSLQLDGAGRRYYRINL